MAAPGSSSSGEAARRDDSGDESMPDHLVVGQVTKAHGTRGEVLVWPLTDSPETVFESGAELILGDMDGDLGDAPIDVVVERARPFKQGLLVKFAEIPDRTVAERLARRYLLASRDRLPPLEEDEVFYHQLLGLEVRTVEGAVVGRVREVYETEPAHLLEVEGEGGRHLVPFVKRIIERIDLEAGVLIIDPPAGLLEV